jgi:lysophospholipase L1-like esterase
MAEFPEAVLYGWNVSPDAPSDDSKLTKTENLSDLDNAATARTNLGLGGSSILNVGTVTNTVAAGDDSRIVTAVSVDGDQTITGDKTFTGLTTITNPSAKDLKYAIEFAGANGSNVFLGVKTYLNAKPFTFGAWVDFYSSALTDDGTVWAYGYSNGNDKGYLARVDGATKKLAFFWGTSTNQATATNTYCYGKMWLVLTYDGATTLKVYKNNVLMDTLTVAARIADATIGSYLGSRDSTGRNLNGAMDDAFLYDRVLTTAERNAIFRTATFPSSGNLFLHHFDERTGTVATDSSGSGNTGTVNSGTYRVSEFGNPNRAPSAPSTWEASLANADISKTCAVFIGSSTTQGADSTTLDNRYTDVYGQLIHQRFNSSSVPGGKHIRAADTGWTTTGTAALNGDGLALGSYALSAGATLSRTMTNCTGFDLHFVQGTGQGTFTYQVDGGTAVTVTPVTTGTANRHDGTVTVTGLTLGSHTIQVNATNACIINGVYVHNGDATLGARVYNSGKGSTSTVDFITTNAATIWQRAVAIGNVNLVAMMMGSNDFSSSLNPVTFKANLLTIIHNVWNSLSATKPDIVLINSYKRFDQVGYGTVYLHDQYADKMKELAAELDTVYYVDVSGLFPLVNDSVHDPLDLMNTDNIHMNDAGHRYMARILLRRLTPSIS